jgi:HK97 family phage portal protein
MYNAAGAIVGLHPVHPLCVSVKRDDSRPGGKRFTVTLEDGQTKDFDASNMLHVCRFSLDGLRGTSPITLARNSIGTGIAGDRAAAKMFSTGALISGLVTPEGDIDPEEALAIKRDLDQKMTGSENAGSVAVINRRLKFTPWSLSAEDAQFLQSRQFQIEEVCRWWGVPPHLLMQSEKSTSWGSGIEEQDRGLARYVLSTWTALLQECLSVLIPTPKFVEFDYSQLLQPSPEQEIELLLKQIDGGLLTLNEARRLRNYPPVDGGDVPRQGFAQPDQTKVDSPQETKNVSASS